jgi:hypothetical protein
MQQQPAQPMDLTSLLWKATQVQPSSSGLLCGALLLLWLHSEQNLTDHPLSSLARATRWDVVRPQQLKYWIGTSACLLRLHYACAGHASDFFVLRSLHHDRSLLFAQGTFGRCRLRSGECVQLSARGGLAKCCRCCSRGMCSTSSCSRQQVSQPRSPQLAVFLAEQAHACLLPTTGPVR